MWDFYVYYRRRNIRYLMWFRDWSLNFLVRCSMNCLVCVFCVLRGVGFVILSEVLLKWLRLNLQVVCRKNLVFRYLVFRMMFSLLMLWLVKVGCVWFLCFLCLWCFLLYLYRVVIFLFIVFMFFVLILFLKLQCNLVSFFLVLCELCCFLVMVEVDNMRVVVRMRVKDVKMNFVIIKKLEFFYENVSFWC